MSKYLSLTVGVVTCMMTVRLWMSYVTLLEDDNKANEVNDAPQVIMMAMFGHNILHMFYSPV